MSGSVVEVSSDGTSYLLVETGSIAGLENVLERFARGTIAEIKAAGESLCTVIELDARPL